jgi:hypothetical protein
VTAEVMSPQRLVLEIRYTHSCIFLLYIKTDFLALAKKIDFKKLGENV